MLGVASTATLTTTVNEAIAQEVSTEQAAHLNADIVISYGDNIPDYEIQGWVEDLSSVGIAAAAETGLDDPNCAALIMNGQELYRYTEDSIFDGQLASTAQLLVEGKEISSFADSDCPSAMKIEPSVTND